MALQEALEPFLVAYGTHSAVSVAQFLSPTAPPHDPGRLYQFWRASSEEKVLANVRYALGNAMSGHAEPDEVHGWVDVIACYWRAVDRILKAEQSQNMGKLGDRQLVDVYDSWKDLTSSFLKHIHNGNLPHWTVFTLYFVANSLRKFAIRADQQLAKTKPVAFNAGLEDDIVSTTSRNKKLEEVVRVLNEIFKLCVHDR
jgi:hypothetical protein